MLAIPVLAERPTVSARRTVMCLDDDRVLCSQASALELGVLLVVSKHMEDDWSVHLNL